jgi:hypothetical protein
VIGAVNLNQRGWERVESKWGKCRVPVQRTPNLDAFNLRGRDLYERAKSSSADSITNTATSSCEAAGPASRGRRYSPALKLKGERGAYIGQSVHLAESRLVGLLLQTNNSSETSAVCVNTRAPRLTASGQAQAHSA